VILYLGIFQLYHIMMEWLLDDAGFSPTPWHLDFGIPGCWAPGFVT